MCLIIKVFHHRQRQRVQRKGVSEANQGRGSKTPGRVMADEFTFAMCIQVCLNLFEILQRGK